MGSSTLFRKNRKLESYTKIATTHKTLFLRSHYRPVEPHTYLKPEDVPSEGYKHVEQTYNNVNNGSGINAFTR